jgi:DMSO/TMAO reductase YedYZ molybdopterin-dependent catalytic subunit
MAVCAAGFALATVSVGCVRAPVEQAAPSKATTATADLGTVEVREYRGKKLGSIDDFRENSIEGPQQVDRKEYRLKIIGEVANPQELKYEDVLAMPAAEKVVTLNCVEGWSVTILWKGVRLRELLEKAGYDRGAKVVVFRCYDGYSTSLPLDYVISRDLLFAYAMNGVPLPPERGFPFQVVAEDRWGYKWAKWVTSIEVSNNEKYRGYWESRGYSNDGKLDRAR